FVIMYAVLLPLTAPSFPYPLALHDALPILYRSGQLLPIREIAEAAHQKGILVGFDLAHSIGAMPHELHDAGVDFAVWCHYKYMKDRKSTRLNSSHVSISYAVFCLKKKSIAV